MHHSTWCKPYLGRKGRGERGIDRETHSTHFIYGYIEGRKEMFYLTMHSTHFIYGYMDQTYGKGPFRQRERKPAAATT